MLVSSISPAPSSAPRAAHCTASSSVGLRPPGVMTRLVSVGGSPLVALRGFAHFVDGAGEVDSAIVEGFADDAGVDGKLGDLAKVRYGGYAAGGDEGETLQAAQGGQGVQVRALQR